MRREKYRSRNALRGQPRAECVGDRSVVAQHCAWGRRREAQRRRRARQARTFENEEDAGGVAAQEVRLLAEKLFQFENRAVAGDLQDQHAPSIPATAPHLDAHDSVAICDFTPLRQRL